MLPRRTAPNMHSRRIARHSQSHCFLASGASHSVLLENECFCLRIGCRTAEAALVLTGNTASTCCSECNAILHSRRPELGICWFRHTVEMLGFEINLLVIAWPANINKRAKTQRVRLAIDPANGDNQSGRAFSHGIMSEQLRYVAHSRDSSSVRPSLARHSSQQVSQRLS